MPTGDRPVLTCPYCKEQKRLGYMKNVDKYHCWGCSKTFPRADAIPERYMNSGLPKVHGRYLPVIEDE